MNAYTMTVLLNLIVLAAALLPQLLQGRRGSRRRPVKPQRVADLQQFSSWKPKRPRTIRPIQRA